MNSAEDHSNFYLPETPPVHSEMFSRFLQAQKNTRCSVPLPPTPLAANINDAAHNFKAQNEDDSHSADEDDDGGDPSLSEAMDDGLFGFEADDDNDAGKCSINKVEKEEEKTIRGQTV